MKKQLLKLFIICLFLGFISCKNSENYHNNVVSEYPEDLVKLHKNVIDYHLNLAINTKEIDKNLNDLQKDGSFNSIDYTDKIRGRWPVKTHLQYVQDFAIAYRNNDSEFYGDKNLASKIQLALNYWLENDFLSTNWHDQHIGVPELLLPTLFLMEDELDQNQKDKALVLLNRAKIKMSGQNKVWLATNVMLRSLFLKKPDSVAIASKAIQSELQISNGVGIKSDWSYHEHGAQLQFGNYGLSFLEDMIKAYAFLNDTPFQFENNKITILRNFILKGQQWVVFDGKMDISASGRQLFPNEQTTKYNRLKSCIEKMMLMDSENSEAYKNALDSKILEGNKHFWESDFFVHRRKGFYFSVKMSSKRVIGTESVNRENIQGYYLGDGTSLLYTSGETYYNIPPFWDWKKLPGTTIVQDDKPLPIIKFSQFKTNSEFVGGVSNEKNGIALMNYDRDGLKAKKSWFMFDDKIICLGSDIEAETEFPVVTSLNQVFYNNKIKAGQNNKIVEEFKNNQTQKLDWILHDSVGYFFPTKSAVHIKSQFLEGSWNRVAKRYRAVILTESILKIGFDHGKNPKNKKYEYILFPNANQQKMEAFNTNNPFKIINSSTQQSVISLDEKIGGIIFYKAGKSSLFGGISVDKPCVILLQKNDVGYEVSLSDPAQKLKEITVQFNESITTNLNDKNSIRIELPLDKEAGKTVKFNVTK